jgi:quercetin dioxygenase-like cupin family protein
MDRQEFEAGLQRDGFSPPVRVERAVGYSLADHDHPFDARAFILAGEITLTVGGVASTYKAGDIFRLAAGTVHLESAGPEGVVYLSGRREAASS